MPSEHTAVTMVSGTIHNPAEPRHFMKLVPVPGRARSTLPDGTILADSTGAYFLIEIGELLLSPIGLSAVTQLSVARVVSLMMGAWFLASAYSEVLAAWLGKLASVPVDASGAFDTAEALDRYASLFADLGWIGLGCGIAVLLVTPWLRSGMGEGATPSQGRVR